jgi:hypothetical protein
LLLAGVKADDLFGRPAQAIGHQHRAGQTMRHQSLESRIVDMELQMPATFSL